MSRWRVLAIISIIFLLSGGVIARLFSLQVLGYQYYSELAQDQHQLYQKLFPERGEIFMQDFSAGRPGVKASYAPLAVNKEFEQVYLVPKDISPEIKDDLAEELAQLLDLDKETILERINKPDDPYEPLKHKVDEETAQKIRELNIKGLSLRSEVWRYYPNQSLACHLIGFVGQAGNDKVGQYGLEGYYEEKLKGKPGFLSGQKDTAGYWIPSFSRRIEPAQDGAQLILTIDPNIQFKAEKELAQAVDQWQAEAGTIIVLEPKSGAIRAMANWPCYNPNQYSQVENIDIFLNPAVQKVYEPGSVFKPITMAAGLDSGRITPETVYRDTGQVRVKGGLVRNADGKVYGERTMTEVLEKSINTGAVFVEQKIGLEIFRDYVQRFNFGQLTGVDLAGEVAGNIFNLFGGPEINAANISFGQGITVTPLELSAAIGTIANQGRLMRPFVVEKIIQSDGQEIVSQPETIRQVISPESAIDLTKMLVSVAERGSGRLARAVGYQIAAKTGTAQVPDLEKGGYSEETIHTFVGFAPAFDPKFVILVKIDKPQGVRWAATSAAPVFKHLAEYLFNYFEIPPTTFKF